MVDRYHSEGPKALRNYLQPDTVERILREFDSDNEVVYDSESGEILEIRPELDDGEDVA